MNRGFRQKPFGWGVFHGADSDLSAGRLGVKFGQAQSALAMEEKPSDLLPSLPTNDQAGIQIVNSVPDHPTTYKHS